MQQRFIATIVGIGLGVLACTSCRSPLPAPPPPKWDTAEARGFLEPSGFAASLVPNPNTYCASNRTAAAVRTYPLMITSQEFKRYETKEFQVVLTDQPLLVRLEADTWHQGATLRPQVEVNDRPAGTFEVYWPTLAYRNYTPLLFDKTSPPGISYSFNYQGWLKAACLIKTDFFVPGTNVIRISVGMDRIKMANLVLESLTQFDEDDSVFDLRRSQYQAPGTVPAPSATSASERPAPTPDPKPWGGSNVTHLVRCVPTDDFHAFHFDGMLNRQTYDVVTDGQDVWIGSAAGLIRYAIPENQWFLYDRSSGLQGDFARNLILSNGYIGVEAWNRHERDYVTQEGRYLLNPSTGEWTPIPKGQFPPAPAGIRIAHDQWIPTHGKNIAGTRDFVGGGVIQTNSHTGESRLFTTRDGLANDYCSDICADGRRIWVAHWYEKNGLSTYDLRTGKWTTVPQSVNGIANIGGPRLLLNHTTLYVGQQGGLVLLNTKSLDAKRYTTRNQLPGYIISGMAAFQSEVWIAAYSDPGSSGIAVFNRRLKPGKRIQTPPHKIEFPKSASTSRQIPEKFLEKADNTAEQLRKALTEEIQSLGSDAWAGEYYYGDGLGANIRVWIAPKTGFLYEWHGCMGLYDRNYGFVSTTSNGNVRLAPTLDKANGGFKALAEEYMPVLWSERTYLIATNELIRFCYAVNSGSEPRQDMHGSFLLRQGDEKKPVNGPPRLPDEYRRYLLDAPVLATIIAVGKKTDKIGVLKTQQFPVTINAGTTSGLQVGMELYVASPESSPFNILTLTEVRKTKSKGTLLFPVKNSIMPKCGWTVSTRPPWRMP